MYPSRDSLRAPTIKGNCDLISQRLSLYPQFDRKFHEWQQRRWEGYMQTREWAETSAPRALWLFDKTHDGEPPTHR